MYAAAAAACSAAGHTPGNMVVRVSVEHNAPRQQQFRCRCLHGQQLGGRGGRAEHTVGLGRQGDGLVLRHLEGVRLARHGRAALEVNVFALLLGDALALRVLLHTVHKVVAALGVADVLDTQVHTLLDLAVAHGLVDQHTHGTREDTVDNAGAALVVLVGHALLLSRVGDNVHNVARLEAPQVAADVRLAMLAKLLRKHVPSTRAVTKVVRHPEEALVVAKTARRHTAVSLRPPATRGQNCTEIT